MKFPIRAVVLAGLLCANMIFGPTAYAVENSGVGGKPARPRADNPRSQSIFVHELAPGTSVNDAVTLINNTDQPKTVEVYAADAVISSGGAFACEQKADTRDQEGTWLTLSKQQVDLPPNGEETVDFMIAVPKNVAGGEHNACIAIQAVEKPAESGANGVQLSFRSAIRVAITVPGEIKKGLFYTDLRVSQNKQKLVVNQKLRNSGNVSLDVRLETKVTTLFGNAVQTISGEYPVLANQTGEFNFEFDRPAWGGLYRVAAAASYNSDSAASLGKSGKTTDKTSRSVYIFVVPTAGPLLFYLLLLAVGAYVLWRAVHVRSHRRKSVPYMVREGDDIQSIAKAHHVSWKLIARMNKLKPPYILAPDSHISLPASHTATTHASTETKADEHIVPKHKNATSKSQRKPASPKTRTTKSRTQSSSKKKPKK